MGNCKNLISIFDTNSDPLAMVSPDQTDRALVMAIDDCPNRTVVLERSIASCHSLVNSCNQLDFLGDRLAFSSFDLETIDETLAVDSACFSVDREEFDCQSHSVDDETGNSPYC